MLRRQRILGASCILGTITFLLLLATGHDQPWFSSIHATSTRLGQVSSQRSSMRALPKPWAGKSFPGVKEGTPGGAEVPSVKYRPLIEPNQIPLLNAIDASERLSEGLIGHRSDGLRSSSVLELSRGSISLPPAPTTQPSPKRPLDAIYSSIQSALIFVKGRKCSALNNFQDVAAKDVVEGDADFLSKSTAGLEPGPNAKPLKIDYVLTYVSPRAMPDTPFLKRSSERYRDWNELHWSLRSIFQNGQLCLTKAVVITPSDSDACLIGNIYLVLANKRHVPKWLQSILDNGLAPFENRHSLEQLNDNNASTLGYNPKCSTIPDREKAFQSFLAKKLKIVEHHQIFPMPNVTAMSPLTKELLQAVSAEAKTRRKQESHSPSDSLEPITPDNGTVASVQPITIIEAYNSNVIDLVLHRIPGLSRHFISVNNDMLLGRKLEMKNVFVEVGDDPTRPGAEENCALIPISYFTETMPTPSDWSQPPDTSTASISQIEYMKRYTVSLMVAFARRSRDLFFPSDASSSLPTQAATIYEFAHVPMLYDRDFMRAISESEPFSPAVDRVLTTQLHGRGLLDIWVPMWYVNIRRLALQFIADGAAQQSTNSVPKLALWSIGDVRLDAAIEKAFVALGTGHVPFKQVLFSHAEFRFVELTSEESVREESLMLSQRAHDGLELFITFNDDFRQRMLFTHELQRTISNVLFDPECAGRVLCSQNMTNITSASLNLTGATHSGQAIPELSEEALDARQILMSFHKIFCTWERAWLGQPRNF